MFVLLLYDNTKVVLLPYKQYPDINISFPKTLIMTPIGVNTRKKITIYSIYAWADSAHGWALM